jgi:multidrug efflux pump subunit AcrB
MRALVPSDVHIDFEFDQSTYVTNSIRGLASEGAIGAVLTALVVLVFLRNWRSALIVVVTIPISILAAAVALRLAGQTVNIMTLSGLSLAVGILVDESTVAIENIHTHLARQNDAGRAVVDAMREVLVPRRLAMLCILAVFIPSFFMVGISRSLFPPLALAVGFAMIASYLLSSTLVPVLAVSLFRRKSPAHESTKEKRRFGDRVRDGYGRFAAFVVRFRWPVIAIYLVVCASAVLVARGIPTELFPRVDTGQFQMRIRARPGLRLERTEQIVREIDRTIRREVGADSVRITLANIGPPAWNFPVNAVYTFNTGPQEAMLLVALAPRDRQHPRPSLDAIEERLRHRFADQFPDVRVSFEAGDIVSQVMNFGTPTPIHVTVASKTLAEARQFAQRVAARLARLPQLRDVQIPQALDYPSLDIAIDRQRAGQFGVSVDRVGRSIVGATSSSVLTTPIFWTDARSGLPYRVAVQVPEQQMASSDDLQNLSVTPDGSRRPVLGDVASVTPGLTPGEVDRYNGQRTVSVTANLAGSDLAGAARDVERAIHDAGTPPRATTATLHGQVEQMRTTLTSLREGLLLAVIAVLLLLVANFQSAREPIAVMATTPAVLAGVAIALRVTNTSLNVQSMMGAVMAIGVSVANAVLLVTFARDRWFAGAKPPDAAVDAARARLRPIVMTSLAMVMGMVPTALAIGEGSEQAAPLGRAVIGGLLASTLATLVFLPAVYVAIARKGPARSASLDPADALDAGTGGAA